MPYILQLSKALAQAGWKVKIHDAERMEHPHVTIYRKLQKWRLSLRDRKFLNEKGEKWSQIDKSVKIAIEFNWNLLKAEWNKIHDDNPVEIEEDDDDSETKANG